MMTKQTTFISRLRTAGLAGLLVAGILGSLAVTPAQATQLSLDRPGQRNALNDALNNNWLPTFPEMSDQFSTVMMHQIFGIGAILDAKHQLETQRLLGQLRAEAHKNFRGSEQMCRYGTNVRNLATAEEMGRVNKRILSQMLQQRLTLRNGSVGERGRYYDERNRFDQFRRIYCDPAENGGTMRDADMPTASVCTTPAGGPRVNNDLDFTRLVDTRLTLDINFTDANMTNDEQDVLALARNLYSHELLDYKPDEVLARQGNDTNIMKMRSLHALRSVAHNSFSEIVGMKSASSGGSVAPFMRQMVAELGVPDADINAYLGENPSYFAQMEMLTRKMYQNPQFYTNLYTSPENLKRTGVALQALQLMHDRDRFEGSLRREMLLSTILEMKLRESQEVVEKLIADRAGRPTGQ